jgi:HD superfamily phosphohydrolase
VDGVICFARQDQALVQRLYRARYLMHTHVYQHPAVKGFELAVAHVLRLTEEWLDLDWLQEFRAVTAHIVNPADPAASKRL